MSVIFAILTFVLILVAIFLIVVVLMQKASSDGGMGGVLGGGVSESTFGADTSNVLSRATINSAIIYFVLSFALYLGWIYQVKHGAHGGGALPMIAGPAHPAGLPLLPAHGPAAPKP